MKKFLTVALVSGMILGSFAAFAAEKAILVLNNGKRIQADSIVIRKGKYEYKSGKTSKREDAKSVKWAWVPMPKEVKAADDAFKVKKYSDAEAKYSSAATTYKLLGWEPYCRLGQIKCLLAQDKKAEARNIMEQAVTTPINPKNAADVAGINSMLIKYYVDEREFDKAVVLIEPLTKSPDENVAAQALFDKAGLLKAQYGSKATMEQLQNVALYYLESALVFPNAKIAPQALLQAYNTLKSLHDARAEKIAKILREKYPNSPEATQIK